MPMKARGDCLIFVHRPWPVNRLGRNHLSVACRSRRLASGREPPYLADVKIYTKTGDAGETSLAGGTRVSKDDVRVAAYGDVDEANAAIGAARAAPPEDLAAPLLAGIQHDLFAIGGALAARSEAGLRADHRARIAVTEERVRALEAAIDEAERELPPLTRFVLPAGTAKAAALHLARTACRRAERSAVHLAASEPVAPEILAYLNRLSDLLFVLARQANARAGRPDVIW